MVIPPSMRAARPMGLVPNSSRIPLVRAAARPGLGLPQAAAAWWDVRPVVVKATRAWGWNEPNAVPSRIAATSARIAPDDGDHDDVEIALAVGQAAECEQRHHRAVVRQAVERACADHCDAAHQRGAIPRAASRYWRQASTLARNGGLLCPAGTALRYRDAAAGMGGGLSPKWVADRQPSSGSASSIRVDALSPGPLTKLSQ